MSILEYSGSSLVSRLHDRHAARRILSVVSFYRAMSYFLYKTFIVAFLGVLLAFSLAPELRTCNDGRFRYSRISPGCYRGYRRTRVWGNFPYLQLRG